MVSVNSGQLNKDAMNGISLMQVFQRTAGWCEAVYGVKCLTREQKPLSGYVIFRAKGRQRSAGFRETASGRNSIPIRVVPRKLTPSSLSF